MRGFGMWWARGVLALGLVAGTEAGASGLGPPPGLQASPALAAGRDGVVAVWIDGREPGGEALYGAVLPPELPDTSAAPWAAGAGGIGDPALGGNAEWNLAVWASWENGVPTLVGQEVGPFGTGALRVMAAEAVRPAVAVRGDVGVVVWESGSGPGIHVARWARGTGPGASVSLSAGGEARWPRIAAGDPGFLVAWSEGPSGNPGQVHALRLDEAGCPQGPAAVLSPGSARAEWPDVAFAADRWLVAWEETEAGTTRLAGRILGADGAVRADLAGPAGEGRPTWTRVAGAGPGFALTWLDLTASGRCLRRTWVDTLGTAHPPIGIPVTAPEDYAADPAIASADGQVTLAWRVPQPEDDDDLRAAQWAVLDTVSVPVSQWLTAVPAGILDAGTVAQSPVLHAAPNPFRGEVEVRGLEAAGTLVVVDARGRRVRTLHTTDPGRWVWDGRAENGERVPAGVYLARQPGRRGALRLVRLP